MITLNLYAIILTMNLPRPTLIALLRDAINDWRTHETWSRETVAQMIVEAHERTGGPARTGIVFNPRTTDSFQRMHVNADRVFRWLDDQTKTTNLMPTDFIPSILAALPEDRRLLLVDEMLSRVGLSAKYSARHEQAKVSTGSTPSVNVLTAIEHTSAATGAFARLLNSESCEDLKSAHKSLTLAAASLSRVAESIEATPLPDVLNERLAEADAPDAVWFDAEDVFRELEESYATEPQKAPTP